MVNKTWIWIIGIILLCNFVFATLDDAVVYYSFDNDTVNGVDIEDLSGTPLHNGTKSANNEPTQIGNGIIADGVDFDGTNDQISEPLTEDLYAFSFWYNPDQAVSVGCTNWEQIFGQSGDYDIFIGQCSKGWDGGTDSPIFIQSSGNDMTGADVTMSVGTWYHLVFNYNASAGTSGTYDIYLNGTKQTTEAGKTGGWASLITTDTTYQIGARNDQLGDFKMDEFAIYNRSLTSLEISNLYNSGSGYNPCGSSSGITLNVSDNSYPNDGDIINTTTITFNTTYNSSNTTSCTLYINGSVEGTQNGLSSGLEQAVSFGNILANGEWVYTINCTNDKGDNSSTTEKTIHIHEPIDISYFGGTYSSAMVGNNITLNCTYTNPTPYAESISYYIYNLNDSRMTEQSSNQYEINNTDYMDALEFYCRVNTTHSGVNSSSAYIADDTIDHIITISVTDYTGSTLDNIKVNMTTINSSYSSVPITIQLSDIIDNGGESILINTVVKDLSNLNLDETFNLNISEMNETISLELDPKELILTFYDSDGSPVNRSGYISDGSESTYSFCNSTFASNQKNLTQEKISVYIGNGTCNMSNQFYYQYFEYLNDWTTQINKTLSIIDNPSKELWIKVMDTSNRPLENALVRLSFSEPKIFSTKEYLFAGQRLTDAQGMLRFYMDSKTDILLEVIKDGYIYERNLTKNADLTNTSDIFPYIITLERSLISTDRGIYLQVPRRFDDRTNTIYGGILALGRSSVSYTTSYRKGIGLGNQTISLDSEDIGYFELIPERDFSQTGTEDITFELILDGETYRNFTIEYQFINKTITSEPDFIDEKTKWFIGWVVIILLAGITGILFGAQEEETGTRSGGVGTTVFFVGAGMMPIIVGSGYWLTMVVGSYYALNYIKKVYSE
ncbi:hypothetical protein GF336_07775 [Candidatus Woesearchaeota archaeon]|nr:hypothetical protein [Candidatus Woesearchaeota archaeon]